MSQCYCGCTDGDPKHCRGWHGWQDEPPCGCLCHQPTHEPCALREALLHIRERTRSDAADFETATIDLREIYQTANVALASVGALFARPAPPPSIHSTPGEALLDTYAARDAAARTSQPPGAESIEAVLAKAKELLFSQRVAFWKYLESCLLRSDGDNGERYRIDWPDGFMHLGRDEFAAALAHASGPTKIPEQP